MNTLLANKIPQVLCYCFLILVSFSCHQLQTQEVDNEREFGYDENSHLGPANWGNIRPEWSMCSNGSMQSPIDVLHERVEVVSSLGELQREYKPSNATLINRGHDMMLSWVENAGHIIINETWYQLRQSHWHSPSEHSINGKRYALETHMVHQSSDGKIAVVGILYKIGCPDPFLSMLENDLRDLATTLYLEKAVGIIDPKQIEWGSRKYYRYIGSLTTPPCTENVTWTILKKVRTVTQEQVNLIRDAVHDDSASNARPIQPLNDRTVQMYCPNIAVEVGDLETNLKMNY